MIKGCQVNIETSLREHPVFSALDITLFCKMLKNKRYLDVKGVVPIRLNPRGAGGYSWEFLVVSYTPDSPSKTIPDSRPK